MHCKYFTKRTDGFSLIELSIVLVILGLLTGGILGGRHLIRAAELRNLTTEASEYMTAVNAFKTKYFSWPGDFKQATYIWGDNTTHCSDGLADNNGATCNGNDDGKINPYQAGPGGSVSEPFLFWQHLSLAGIIAGTYTGVSGADASTQAVIGENIPESGIPNAGWTFWYVENYGHTGVNFTLNKEYGNVYMFGAKGNNFEIIGLC